MTTVGNHEVGDGEQFVSYRARYPMPSTQSGSTDSTYWSRSIEGIHVIALNSYQEWPAKGSLQHLWLEEDLQRVTFLLLCLPDMYIVI
jgi:acid phosphatase type 7